MVDPMCRVLKFAPSGYWRHAAQQLDTHEQTLYARRPERDGELIHHCDRGSQYVFVRHSQGLAEAGIEPSLGSKGDSHDNPLAETINGLYKAEVIHRRSWPNRESVELATLQWVSWFKHHRLLGPIGCIPPAEAEAIHHRQFASQNSMVVARLKPTGLHDSRGVHHTLTLIPAGINS